MSSCALIVLTLNEEAHIERCIRSTYGLASQIFVVDSGSTDSTTAIARSCGATVVSHDFTTQAEQFNWALDSLPIAAEWILRLDADEYLLPELRQEIVRCLPRLGAHVTGLVAKRRVYFMGRWIRHGGYYPTWLLRVIRRGAGRSEDLAMDEHLVVRYGTTVRLSGDFVDENLNDLRFWTIKHESYATREAGLSGGRARRQDGITNSQLTGQAATKRWLKGNIYQHSPLLLRAVVYFLYRYVFRGGFLDGTEGFIFHFLQGCWYRVYVDAKIKECASMRLLPKESR